MDWTEIIIALISLVIAPAVLLLLKEGAAYLKQRAAAVADADARERIEHYLALAEGAVEVAVLETSQVMVDVIKGTDEWTPDAMQEALRRSKARATEIMGTAAYKALFEVVDDVNAWITARIEAAVKCNREEIANA